MSLTGLVTFKASTSVQALILVSSLTANFCPIIFKTTQAKRLI
jgi:hypothetical protein